MVPALRGHQRARVVIDSLQVGGVVILRSSRKTASSWSRAASRMLSRVWRRQEGVPVLSPPTPCMRAGDELSTPTRRHAVKGRSLNASGVCEGRRWRRAFCPVAVEVATRANLDSLRGQKSRRGHQRNRSARSSAFA